VNEEECREQAAQHVQTDTIQKPCQYAGGAFSLALPGALPNRCNRR
jgi:hypothetical protein